MNEFRVLIVLGSWTRCLDYTSEMSMCTDWYHRLTTVVVAQLTCPMVGMTLKLYQS